MILKEHNGMREKRENNELGEKREKMLAKTERKFKAGSGKLGKARREIRVCFFGGCREVGRSAVLVEGFGKKILIDAGVKVGRSLEFPEVQEKTIKAIDFVIVSHAHLDHSGFLPVLVKKGFKGRILATKPTRDLVQLLLSDALNIERERGSREFQAVHVEKVLKSIEIVGFEEWKKLSNNILLKFYHSGHILGSAQVMLKLAGKHLLYSSDINSRQSNLLEALKLPKEKPEALIVESTYGGKNDLLESLKTASKKLADEIKKTISEGGKVLIPVFAVGRGQEIMLALENYIRSGYLKEVNVFVDGMVGKANKICRHNVLFLKPEIPKRILLADDDPFKSPFIKTPRTKDKSDVLKARNAVIIASSGMLTGGASLGYFKKLSGDEKNLIILVGYQAPESIGRQLMEGRREFEFEWRKLKVKAKVSVIKFSGHADFNGLLEYVKAVKASKVFVMHGEESKEAELAERIKNKLKKTVIIPKNKECFNL